MTHPHISRKAREILAAEMKAEWSEIYRDRDTGELPSEESWLERANNAPASLRAIESALLSTEWEPIETKEDGRPGGLSSQATEPEVSALRASIPDAECRNCGDGAWVCENHQDRPWGGTSARADACGCGAGAPCPVCRWDMANAHLLSVFSKLRASLEEAVASMEHCAKDMNADPPWYIWHEPGDGLEPFRAVIADAQAIEARRAETQSGSVHESAVAESDAPNPKGPAGKDIVG